jgi:hypothetical protein
MTNTKPSKTERQSNELKGNLGQKEAQLEKEKDSDLSHMVRNPAKPIKNRVEVIRKPSPTRSSIGGRAAKHDSCEFLKIKDNYSSENKSENASKCSERWVKRCKPGRPL